MNSRQIMKKGAGLLHMAATASGAKFELMDDANILSDTVEKLMFTISIKASSFVGEARTIDPDPIKFTLSYSRADDDFTMVLGNYVECRINYGNVMANMYFASQSNTYVREPFIPVTIFQFDAEKLCNKGGVVQLSGYYWHSEQGSDIWSISKKLRGQQMPDNLKWVGPLQPFDSYLQRTYKRHAIAMSKSITKFSNRVQLELPPLKHTPEYVAMIEDVAAFDMSTGYRYR